VAAAETLELLFLKNAEQLRLKLERKIADPVEKQRAAVRGLKASDGLRHGTHPDIAAHILGQRLRIRSIRASPPMHRVWSAIT